MTQKVRTRIAPSPTGFLHLGTAQIYDDHRVKCQMRADFVVNRTRLFFCRRQNRVKAYLADSRLDDDLVPSFEPLHFGRLASRRHHNKTVVFVSSG